MPLKSANGSSISNSSSRSSSIEKGSSPALAEVAVDVWSSSTTSDNLSSEAAVSVSVSRGVSGAACVSSAAGSAAAATLSLTVPTAFFSAFMNNTPIVAMLLPVTEAWAARCSIPAQWLVLAATNVAWATCAMLPWARLQYATFFLYTFWRMFTWVTLFATVGRCYPNDSGTVAGMAQSVTGLVLLLQEPLRASNLRLFPANFVPLQLGLTLLAATSSCLCARACSLGF